MTTLEKVKEIIAANLGVPEEDVTPEANLIDDLGCDSLDGIELAADLENAFDLIISDEEAEGAQTVAQVVELIDSKLAATK